MDLELNDGLSSEGLPAWHEAALAALDFPFGWKGGEAGPRGGEPDPEAWKRRGREAFRALLLEDCRGLDPEPRLEAAEAREGYELRVLSLRIGRHRRSRAYLAVPEGRGPFPAALLLHDHGARFDIGKEKMISPPAGHPRAAAAAEWAAANYGGRFVGDELARRGCIALCVDALGWGDRACGGYESQQAVASNLLGLGSSWAGLIAAEDEAAAAFLASLPEADPSRLAAVGFSMGAFRSWQLAALSDEVRAAVAICSFGTLSGLMAPGGNRLRGQSAFAMTHPGLSRLMDFPDLAGLAAPKPLYMLHGLDDRLFPLASLREAYARTSAIYRAFGANGRFRAELRPGGHVFSVEDQEGAFAWLRETWEEAAGGRQAGSGRPRMSELSKQASG